MKYQAFFMGNLKVALYEYSSERQCLHLKVLFVPPHFTEADFEDYLAFTIGGFYSWPIKYVGYLNVTEYDSAYDLIENK